MKLIANISKQALWGLIKGESFSYKYYTSKGPKAEDRYIVKESPVVLNRIITKNMIKVFLLLHYHTDSKGLVQGITIAYVAKKLEIAYNTAQASLIALNDSGLITLSLAEKGEIRLFITGYSLNFSNKSKGGLGYFKMTNALFDQIIKMLTVDSVRMTLLALLHMTRSSQKKILFNTRYIKSVVKSLNFNRRILKALSKEVFDTRFHDGQEYYLHMNKSYDPEQAIEKLKQDVKAALKYIESNLTENAFILIEHEQDILKLSMEHGLQKMINLLEHLSMQTGPPIPSENVGGLLNNLISA